MTMNNSGNYGENFSKVRGKCSKQLVKRSFTAVAVLSLMVLGLVLAGCGGSSSGVSSQVVSGTAAVGAALSGQVSLKDSSAPAQLKSTNIANDGTYAIDVTGMKAPYVLQAQGSAAGTSFTLNSYADGTGTANINPLSDVIVASAAGVDNPSDVFDKADAKQNNKIGSNIATAVATILNKLQPLLANYSADHTNPITARYITNHVGLDDMFDNLKITVSNGNLSIVMNSGAVVFTGKVSDIANGIFNPAAIPQASAPTTPAGLSALGGSGQMTLSWSSVSNATSYNLYYATASGVTATSGTKITTTAAPYLQTGLAAGTTYYYVVTAVNSAGESPASAQVSASTAAAAPAPTVPAAPGTPMATGGTNQVTLSWGAVSTATSYNVYYGTASGVTTASGTKIPGATSPAVLTGLAASTSYYYIVTAVNSVGEGAASVQVAATTLATVPSPTVPAPPAGVTAMGGANKATISWPAVSGAASYNIYWSTASGVTKASGTKIAGATSPYVQSGLSAGTTYYYVVTAINSVGESAASAASSASTTAAAPALPAAPTGASATGATKQVTASWPAVSGATSYNLYWSTASGVTTASGTKITGAASPYVQTGLNAGTSYFYIVTAVNAAGEGPASAQFSASTSAPAPVLPGAPGGVTATGGTAQASITWSAVSGATSYNLYYSTANGVTTANGTKVAGAASPKVLTGLSDGTTYYFVVTAVNAAGEGAASAQASAATSAPVATFDALSYYNNTCLGCHGSLGVRSVAQITAALGSVGAMKALGLTAAQIAAIAAVSY